MNKYIKSIIISATAVLSFGTVAQNTNSAYFIDGYTHRYELNPAFANEKNLFQYL